MPRTPNYSFERSERTKAKALKKAERLQAKAEKSEARKDKSPEGEAREPGDRRD